MQRSKKVLSVVHALGTVWYVEVFDISKDVDIFKKVRKSLENCIFAYENSYSRFIKSSLLSKLNIEKVIRNPPAELKKLVNLGVSFYKSTNGVFDITVASTLEEYGYGSTLQNKRIESRRSLDENILINENEIVLKNNVSLDFGGYGKGFLIDKIVRLLEKSYGIKEVLINAGGDIYATSCGSKPVTVFLQDPVKREKVIGKVNLKNSALCGSSSYKRVWKKGGKDFSHILDPKNNYNSVTDSYSFVSSKTCCTADMLATTICIRDDEEFIRTLEKSYEFSVIEV